MKSRLLIVIITLQVLILLAGQHGGVAPAMADLKDPAAQRDQIVEQLKLSNQQLQGINDRLDKLIAASPAADRKPAKVNEAK